ncbi:MAG: DNA alkylation repair protein, partial [Spirochaetia bacterium]|nr:DNA alkylation repair protein [Spirochaetia bacterium]
QIEKVLASCLSALAEGGRENFLGIVQREILRRKIKFPVLEYFARAVFPKCPRPEIVVQKIIEVNEIGSFVVAGIFLQEISKKRLAFAIDTALDAMSSGNTWYACDILAERVLGNVLLRDFKNTMALFDKISRSTNPWARRSIGVASHYAIKKGLTLANVKTLFKFLLKFADSADFHTQRGVGWAAKTTAKFHPDFIRKKLAAIQKNPALRRWFKAKLEMGLRISELRALKRAKRNPG